VAWNRHPFKALVVAVRLPQTLWRTTFETREDSMARTSQLFVSMIAAALLAHGASAQGLVEQKNISLALAEEIANAAMDKCKEMGFHASIEVVDREGLPIVLLRGDGAGLATPEGADRKAFTARAFSAPSAAFVKRTSDPALSGSRSYTRTLALAGGLPIKAGDDVVGAIGVSGTPGKDDDCAQAGIDKAAAELK
jgi:uncharacterized protein GlcG (DUF336 family)